MNDNKVDDGEKDAIKSFRYFSVFGLYIMLCINSFIESKKLSDSNVVGYVFLIVFGVFFVFFPTMISCFFGSCAITKYDKYCINKSGSRKKLNTLNKISLILMGLFFVSIIFMFLWFKFSN